ELRPRPWCRLRRCETHWNSIKWVASEPHLPRTGAMPTQSRGHGTHFGLRARAGLDNAVEQELERPVRLPTEQNLRPEQGQPPLAHAHLNHRRRPVQVVLPVRPAAAPRRLAVEPRQPRQVAVFLE